MTQFGLRGAAVAMIAGLTALWTAGGAPSANAEDLISVSVAESGGPLSAFAPFMLGIGSGAFARHGIKIVEQPYPGGVPAFSAFAGGTADMCICGATQVLAYGLAGRDVVGVFNQFLGGAVVFIGAKKYEKDRGTDLKKYDGATWGYTAEGAVSQVFMIRSAQSVGLDWSKQKGLAVGGVDAFIPSLREGRVDIETMDGRSAAQAMKLDIGYLVFNTMEPKDAEPIWGKQLGPGTLITSNAYIQKHPEVMQRIADGFREALLYVQQHADDPDAIFKQMPPSFQEANKDDFKTQWEFWKHSYGVVDGTFTDQQLKDTVAFGVSSGAVKVPAGVTLDPKKYFVNTWAGQALKNVPGK